MNPEESEIEHIEGWVIAQDPESGKNYWANIFTQETTWEEPEAVVNHNKMKAEAKQHARRMTRLSQNDWVAVVDKDSGQTYYFNKATRETSWEKPAGFVESTEEDKSKEGHSEKKKEDVVFQEKSKVIGSNENKFFDKSLTVVSDENKEISKLEQYSDVFRQATEFNFDNTPYSPDSMLDFSKIDKEIIKKVNEKSFNDFCEEYLPKRTSWGKPIPNDKIMTYQNKQLSKCITNLPKNIESIAIQTFKNILSYSGDRKSSKNEIRHAQKLILMCMNAPSEVRDEVFFQLIKQLQNNPHKDKLIRVWKLFSVLSSVFPPSDTTYYAILNYLQAYSQDKNNDEDMRGYAKYNFYRLVRSFEDEVRKEPPSVEEIKYVEAKKQIMVPFYFMTGAHTLVPIESYSTAQEVKESIFTKLDLNKQRLNYYSLYEICEKTDVIEERFIENNERILDLLSSWEYEKNLCKNNKPSFKMYLRVRVFFEMKESDLDTVVMYYTQMVYDVVNGRIPLKENDIITLAALQMQVDFGDYKGNFDKILEKIEAYIPVNKFDEATPKAWLDKILPVYTKLSGYKKYDARLAYLDYLKNFHLYLSQQYYVKYSKRNPNDEDIGIPDNVTIILAIKPSAVLLCDATTKEPFPKKEEKQIHSYTFKEILTWGVSTEYFVLVIGTASGDKQEKIYLETSQGKAIDFLMSAYTNLSLGKSISHLATSLTHSTKKTADSLKVNTQKVANRNATVFPKKSSEKPKK